jgi:hypothetical protein
MDIVRGFDFGHSMCLISPGGRSRSGWSPRHGTKNAGQAANRRGALRRRCVTQKSKKKKNEPSVAGRPIRVA